MTETRRMISGAFLLATTLMLLATERGVSAFVSTSPTFGVSTTAQQHKQSTILFALESDDFSLDDNTSDNNNDDLLTALKKRQLDLSQSQEEIQQRWRTADCQRRSLELPDWVRRVSVQYPLAACGSSSGDVYVIHCESGDVIGRGQTEEDQRKYADVPMSPELMTATKQLFGDFDGGGTLALAFSDNNLIAHAGRNRNGGVELWKFDASSDAAMGLVSKGILLEDTLVTSLEWAQDDLWIGTQDGRVLVYSFDDYDDEEDEEDLSSELTQKWKVGGTVLSLSYHEELDVTVVTTSKGKVELLSVEDSTRSQQRVFHPPFDSGRMRSNVFPLCAIIVEQKNDNNNSRQFALACGGNDGSIFLQSLNLIQGPTETTLAIPELDFDKPFVGTPAKSLTPAHVRPCKTLVTPFPGIMLSGGTDGTIRVWDLTVSSEDTKKGGQGLYIMAGFKVWLGSLWSDGTRLVTDGADNTIMVCDFGKSFQDE